jgi:hypothetical protein
VIIVEKREINKLFVLPSSRNKNNSNYHGKNMPASSATPQPKAKAPQPSIQAFPTKGNSSTMLRRRSTMLTRKRCFKPMLLKFKLYKMNSNH